ncbi:MAG TPA: PQQ-binding-like beta-propeller repeat protein [Solirubrobacterales bacterium]|nr:PQQ-binding-like beta-propeller repeat protein [Solirubrobacterales bacterium]
MSKRSKMRGSALLALAALLALGAFVAGCGGGDSASSADATLTGNAYPGIDQASTREADGQIKRANVSELEEAWSLPSKAQSTYGAYAASPVISNGVVYMQDLESSVQAINLESGDVIWTYKSESATQGPNGVVVGDGKVFGATNFETFALDQKTGKKLWSVPVAETPLAIDMAPGYEDGLVYVSTVPVNVNSEYQGGAVGTLYALDAKTGKKVWTWDTVPKSLWGDKKINSGGGLWYPPSFDEKGSMYFGTGNPVPYPGTPNQPWGASRPGPNLYTNSLVKLDAKTGKLDWYYQQTPHDVYDWDFQNSPILAKAGGREVAIGSGKNGIVTAVDVKTGKPVWSTPVGKHNGHDDDGVLAMHGQSSKIKEGEVFPGTLGGVIAPAAANATTVFVPVVNHALTVTGGAEIGEAGGLEGGMVALDINTGKVKWEEEYPTAAFGAPVVINDVVFFTTFDGTVHGLDVKSGGEVWSGSLPAGSNSAVTASGDTLVVPAGLATQEGQQTSLVAFRLGG